MATKTKRFNFPRSADEKAAVKIVRAALKGKKAAADPHSAWYQKIISILSEQKKVRAESYKVLSAFRSKHRRKPSVPSVICDGKLEYATNLQQLQTTAISHINAMAMTWGWDHKATKAMKRRFAERERDLRKQIKAYDAALRKSGYTALDKRADRLMDRTWALQDKICLTRARTLEGVAIQAEVIAKLLGEQSSGLARDQDVKAARNIVATLARLLKGRA